ncbi:MAG TPA: class I SAM-dependent methyltransferase [Candidatus Binatia bacterium]|nr:class I SAM-dependent methyltransferase [Candidatus Binatia bacterium]
MDPIPDDLAPFYAGGYQAIPATLDELREMAKPQAYRLEPILKYKTAGKLLDIGPWIGLFSSNAKDAGFEVTAIEMNADCVAFLNNVVGIGALQSSDPALTLGTMHEQFDVITLWHCLEHLRNPWQVVEQAARRLVPGGILLIAIPNIESYQFGVLKQAWWHLDAPRHLFFYPAKTLENLCYGCGLVSLEITTGDRLSRTLSRDAWYVFARSLVRVRYVRGMLGLMLAWASSRKEGEPNAGAGLTAIFQRPFDSDGSKLR